MTTQTIISSTATYCTAARFTNRIDWRSVADFLSDDGVRLPTKTAVEANAILAQLLKAASGEVESVAMVGGRYTADDLRAIADAVTATNATELLADIVAGIAFWKVLRRRPDPNRPVPEATKEAREWLEKLASGATIFGTQEAADAGVVDSVMETRSDIENTRKPLTFIASRFFGERTDRTWQD